MLARDAVSEVGHIRRLLTPSGVMLAHKDARAAAFSAGRESPELAYAQAFIAFARLALSFPPRDIDLAALLADTSPTLSSAELLYCAAGCRALPDSSST